MVPRDARLRPRAAGGGERGGRRDEPAPAWDFTRALASAAGKDAEILRVRLQIVSLLQSVDEALSTPGVFERVIELGAGWRDEPTYGASREEFLQTLAG